MKQKKRRIRHRRSRRDYYAWPWNDLYVDLKLYVSPKVAERIWELDDRENKPRTPLNISKIHT